MLQLSEPAPEALTAQYWGLLLNFAFLHSFYDSVFKCLPLWPPPFSSQESFPSHLPWAFPTAQLLTFAHLPVTLRAQTWEHTACAELRELWALPLPIRLCLGTEMDGWMVLWEKFLSSNQTLSSLYPGPILAPEGAKCRGWLTGRIWSQTPVWPKPSPAFWPTLECFSVWQLLRTVSIRLTQRLASQSLGPTQFPTWRLNTRFH